MRKDPVRGIQVDAHMAVATSDHSLFTQPMHEHSP